VRGNSHQGTGVDVSCNQEVPKTEPSPVVLEKQAA